MKDSDSDSEDILDIYDNIRWPEKLQGVAFAENPYEKILLQHHANV